MRRAFLALAASLLLAGDAFSAELHIDEKDVAKQFVAATKGKAKLIRCGAVSSSARHSGCAFRAGANVSVTFLYRAGSAELFGITLMFTPQEMDVANAIARDALRLVKFPKAQAVRLEDLIGRAASNGGFAELSDSVIAKVRPEAKGGYAIAILPYREELDR